MNKSTSTGHPYWVPEPFWEGRDVYIIGGGTSLEDFDWKLLEGRKTIGCNSAFILGEEVCDICVFGDFKFWENSKKELKRYKGRVVSIAPSLYDKGPDWLTYMPRINVGLGTTELGWNGNTGSAATNLALILGAKRVFLLGFDMKLNQDRKANWHDRRFDRENHEVYVRFMRGFNNVEKFRKNLFPDREIINVTDDSKLETFPKVPVAQHFREGK